MAPCPKKHPKCEAGCFFGQGFDLDSLLGSHIAECLPEIPSHPHRRRHALGRRKVLPDAILDRELMDVEGERDAAGEHDAVLIMLVQLPPR